MLWRLLANLRKHLPEKWREMVLINVHSKQIIWSNSLKNVSSCKFLKLMRFAKSWIENGLHTQSTKQSNGATEMLLHNGIESRSLCYRTYSFQLCTHWYQIKIGLISNDDEEVHWFTVKRIKAPKLRTNQCNWELKRHKSQYSIIQPFFTSIEFMGLFHALKRFFLVIPSKYKLC